MSNRRRIKRRVSLDIAIRAARIGAKVDGCTCEPDITYPEHPTFGSTCDVYIAHDDDCPLYNAGDGTPILIRDHTPHRRPR